MARFNLLDEAWIRVIVDDKGTAKEVSLKDVFENAHIYKSLAGDMETQDFALMRVLLAVMHTVFSRFNAKGKEYGYFDLDDRFKQVEGTDEDYKDEYIESLYNTWFELWKAKKFPNIIVNYLEKWRDRFYLFDDEYPFFQVRSEDISEEKISKAKASSILGKNINRLISESGNKIALFSPKFETNNNKDILNESEIVRWLIMFQSYTGLSDKVIFGKEKYKSSKGWLFDLGGIYFKSDNLFETLMMNFVIAQEENDNILNIQKPCWEYESGEIIEAYFDRASIDNMASLYTAWSRGIYINPDIELAKPFEFSIVKLPEINHQDNFLEPMTVWKYNKNGENKDTYTPRKHQANKAMWRSFGMIAINDINQRRPLLIDWINKLKQIARENGIDFISKNTILCATSMQDDANATSWVPIDEIIDYLNIDEYVLTDLSEDGWVVRINDVVEESKKVVGFIFKNYVKDIKEIRNVNTDTFVSQKVEELYFKIDHPFREWLASISIEDEKEEKIEQWMANLKTMVTLEAKTLLSNANNRDYTGIEVGGKIKNISTAYNSFKRALNKELK